MYKVLQPAPWSREDVWAIYYLSLIKGIDIITPKLGKTSNEDTALS